jgi:hypothetical protein
MIGGQSYQAGGWNPDPRRLVVAASAAVRPHRVDQRDQSIAGRWNLPRGLRPSAARWASIMVSATEILASGVS